MSHSLKNTQNKGPIKAWKESFTSNEISRLVFSYSVKTANSTVVLQQLETGFTLSIKMIPLEDTIRVTQFTLNQNTKIASLSLELDEAAVLEMLLQALVILFAQAQQHQAKEIFFILSQQDVDCLSIIESFFDDISCVNTREGLKISFTVYNTPMTRSFLKEKVQSISTQIKQALWQEQRHSHFVRHFLHTAEKGKPLFDTAEKASPTLSKDEPFNLNFPSTKMPIIPASNVISFPVSKSPIKLKTIIKRKKNHEQ